MFEKSGFLQAGFYDNYNRCKQAEHAHSAPLTWLLVFLINEGCVLIWFLSILQLRLNQLAKTLQKGNKVRYGEYGIRITIHKSFI